MSGALCRFTNRGKRNQMNIKALAQAIEEFKSKEPLGSRPVKVLTKAEQAALNAEWASRILKGMRRAS